MNFELYFLDEEGKVVGTPRRFSAASAAVAEELADKLREGRRADLWGLNGKIRSFEGKPGRPTQ